MPDHLQLIHNGEQLTNPRPTYSRTISRREQKRLAQMGVKRPFDSGHRELTYKEFEVISLFRKERKEWNKKLGVAGRGEVRLEAEREPDKYGVTEFDCAGWAVILGGDIDRFRVVLNENINVISFSKYWSAGIHDDDFIIDSIMMGKSVDSALEEYMLNISRAVA